MNKGLIRKISLVICGVLVASFFTGCDIFETVNLSSEQSELVAEYAAGKLLQYEKGHKNGIEQVKDLNFEELNPGYVPPEEDNPLAPNIDMSDNPLLQKPENQESEGYVNEDNSDIDQPIVPDDEAVVDSPAIPTKSIAESLGVDNASIEFDSVELLKKYPNDDSQLVLSMKATEGKDLLIAHFNVENSGDEDINVSTNNDNFRARISINGGSKVRGDVTLLDNDLMNYSNTIPAHSSAGAVFVFEVKAGEQISTLDLIIVDSESNEQRFRLIG